MSREKQTLSESALTAYRAVRESAALMDRSAWGRVHMTGEDRVDILHRMSTNEVRDLSPGLIRHTILTSDAARIVAVLTIYAFSDDLLITADPGGSRRMIDFLNRYIFFRDDVELTDVTGETGMISLWGPRAAALLEDLAGPEVADLAGNAFFEVDLAGGTVVVARSDELRPAGYNLIVPDREAVEPLRHRLSEAGAEPMTDSVYETLRIEAGHPSYEHEMNGEFTPLEVGLKSMINFDKGCYIGQEIIARQHNFDKVKQRLVGVFLEGLPAGDDRPTLMANEDRVGFLTSWTQSPSQGPIALGYVLSRYLEPGMRVEAVDAERWIPGQIVDLPFA